MRSIRSSLLAATATIALMVACAGRQAGAPAPRAGETDWAVAAVREPALRDTLQRLLDRARRDSVFPGGIAVAGDRQGVLAWARAGTLDWAPSPDVSAETLWDLASLTKLVALTTTIATLVDDRTLTLDDRVQRWVPEWTVPGAAEITVRDLLLHRSGLPAHRNFYLQAQGLSAVRAIVLSTPLDTLPRTRMVYSDLGAIILGMVVERATGLSFDDAVRRRVLEPAGMRDTRFTPAEREWARTAPTERDPWRGRLVRGEVHDENAFAMGGVSSHAGLFSTARDMERFARLWLAGGVLDGRRVIREATVREFSTVVDSTFSSRAIGWDTPTGTNSAGTVATRPAYGHTGFTGTSLWIDPRRDRYVLLLTNRVNPRRERTGIAGVRIAVADAVFSGVR